MAQAMDDTNGRVGDAVGVARERVVENYVYLVQNEVLGCTSENPCPMRK